MCFVIPIHTYKHTYMFSNEVVVNYKGETLATGIFIRYLDSKLISVLIPAPPSISNLHWSLVPGVFYMYKRMLVLLVCNLNIPLLTHLSL